MTGFGRAVAENENFQAAVEVRTLNSKFLDLNLRLPKNLADKEMEVRNLVTRHLGRGKVSLTVDIQQLKDVGSQAVVNKELIKVYYEQLKEASIYAGENQNPDLFRMATQLPNAIETVSDDQMDTQAWQDIKNVIIEALEDCTSHRKDEGDVLGEELKNYITTIRTGLDKVIERDPERVKAIRERIYNHAREFLADDHLDHNRYEQEMIYYIEKLDISEEKVRLKAHLDYFNEMLDKEGNNGKKLGFIAQEIGREINTIGSKANDAEIQRTVVDMKDELEKIKEQILNVV